MVIQLNTMDKDPKFQILNETFFSQPTTSRGNKLSSRSRTNSNTHKGRSSNKSKHTAKINDVVSDLSTRPGKGDLFSFQEDCSSILVEQLTSPEKGVNDTEEKKNKCVKPITTASCYIEKLLCKNEENLSKSLSLDDSLVVFEVKAKTKIHFNEDKMTSYAVNDLDTKSEPHLKNSDSELKREINLDGFKYKLKDPIAHPHSTSLNPKIDSIYFHAPNESVSSRQLFNSSDEANARVDDMKQCPLCLRKFDKIAKHMKSCASKHKVSTRQLFAALELQEKQATEREALGLPNPVEPKAVKRNVVKKVEGDSNLQLALALSASLCETEVLKEAEGLCEAGLQEEAELKRMTLEGFGFASSRPTAPSRSRLGSGRQKLPSNPVLLTRTKADRERMITEKVAIILVGDGTEEITTSEEFIAATVKLRSKRLRKYCDAEARLWVIASLSPSSIQKEVFYVEDLSCFVSPSKVEDGTRLRHLSQVPGRHNIPKPDVDQSCDNQDFFVPPDELFNTLPRNPLSADIYSSSTIKKKICKNLEISYKFTEENSTTSSLVNDWRSILGEKVMSDINIYSYDENVIPAHKLVLFVRCPMILDGIIKQLKADGTENELLAWPEVSMKSCLAFLEYLYCGTTTKISCLNEDQRNEVKKLVERYHVVDLRKHMKTMASAQEELPEFGGSELMCSKGFDGVASMGVKKPCTTVNRSEHSHEDRIISLHVTSEDKLSDCSVVSGENVISDVVTKKSNSFVIAENQVDRAESPDLFSDTDESGHDSNENFDCAVHTQCSTNHLASTISKEVQIFNSTALAQESKLSFNDNKVVLISPLVSFVADRKSFEKRKHSDSESSDVESATNKKHCIELLGELTPHLGVEKEQVFDLTQCSNESNSDIVMIDSDSNETKAKDADMLNLQDKSASTPVDDLSSKDESMENYLDSLTQNELETSFNPEYDTCNKDDIRSNSVHSSLQSDISNHSGHSDVDKCFIDPVWEGYEEVNDYQEFNYPPIKNIELSDGKKTPVRLMSPIPWKSSSSLKLRKPGSYIKFVTLESPNVSKRLWERHSSDSDLVQSGRSNNLRRSTSNYRNIETALLDDSLVINDSLFDNLPSGNKTKHHISQSVDLSPESANPSSLVKNSCSSIEKTPSPQIIFSDKVTPLADYSAMKTPTLKKELKKFGLKPGLGRRKAKLLLRYIYDQTHPVVPDSWAPPSRETSGFKRPDPNIQIPKSPVKKPGCISESGQDERVVENVDEPVVDSESDHYDTSSQKSASECESLLEESFWGDQEESLSQRLPLSQNSKVNLGDAVKDIIKSDQDLYERILLYEPIFLKEFEARLKTNGVKFKKNDLMDYLDEKCITFRLPKSQRTRRKAKQTRSTGRKKRAALEGDGSKKREWTKKGTLSQGCS